MWQIISQCITKHISQRISKPGSSGKQSSVSSPWLVPELILVHEKVYALSSQGLVTPPLRLD